MKKLLTFFIAIWSIQSTFASNLSNNTSLSDTSFIEIILCKGAVFMGFEIHSDTIIVQGPDAAPTAYLVELVDSPPLIFEGDQAICKGQSSEINVPGFNEYSWSTGNQTSFIHVTEAGFYTVEVVDWFGCVQEDSIFINTSEVNADFSTMDASCFNTKDGSIFIENITGTDGPFQLNYTNENIADSETLNDLSAGNYELTISNSLACKIDTIIEITSPPEPIVNIQADTIQMGRGQISTLLTDTNPELNFFEWTPTIGLDCSDCAQPDIATNRTSTYYLTGSDMNGCTAKDSVFVQYDDKLKIFMPNIFTPDGDGDNDMLSIHGPDVINQIKSLMIFNRWGSKIYQANNLNITDMEGIWDGTASGKELASDVYVVNLVVTLANGEEEMLNQSVTLIR